VMKEDDRQRLRAIRGHRRNVTERAIGQFRRADGNYGERVAKTVATRRRK